MYHEQPGRPPLPLRVDGPSGRPGQHLRQRVAEERRHRVRRLARLSSKLHYSGVGRRGLFSKAIRLGLYTCILYVYTYICYIYTYIYGFLVCPYARSLGLAARQFTPWSRAVERKGPCLYVCTDGSRRACGIGACARLLPTKSDPRETSGPRIDRIPPTRPSMPGPSISRVKKLNFFAPQEVSHCSLWTINERKDTRTAA